MLQGSWCGEREVEDRFDNVQPTIRDGSSSYGMPLAALRRCPHDRQLGWPAVKARRDSCVCQKLGS